MAAALDLESWRGSPVSCRPATGGMEKSGEPKTGKDYSLLRRRERQIGSAMVLVDSTPCSQISSRLEYYSKMEKAAFDLNAALKIVW